MAFVHHLLKALCHASQDLSPFDAVVLEALRFLENRAKDAVHLSWLRQTFARISGMPTPLPPCLHKHPEISLSFYPEESCGTEWLISLPLGNVNASVAVTALSVGLHLIGDQSSENPWKQEFIRTLTSINKAILGKILYFFPFTAYSLAK